MRDISCTPPASDDLVVWTIRGGTAFVASVKATALQQTEQADHVATTQRVDLIDWLEGGREPNPQERVDMSNF